MISSTMNQPVSNYLYAPWRSIYQLRETTGCHFCCIGNEQKHDAREFVLKRYTYCYVMLNLYPYNKGHVLVIPYSHTANLYDLSVEEQTEIMNVVANTIKILEDAFHCQGINMGLNGGRSAGASIPDHLHFHIVPRFSGDTAFMEAIFDTRIISAHIPEVYQQLYPFFNT